MRLYSRTVCQVIALLIGAVSAPAQGLRVREPEGWLHVNAVAPNIIRITTTPSESMPLDRLPVVVGHFASPSVRISQARVLETKDLRVLILPSGAIKFENSKGDLLTSEIPGTKHLDRFDLPGFLGEAAYHAKQSFTLGATESIYGLGQHQDGELDRKGTSTLLSQSNREVAIPWLVSSKGYGILWNDASKSLVDSSSPGDPDELVDDSGVRRGLTGHYFQGTSFERPVGERRDTSVDFNWTENPPLGLPKDNYSVRWTGSFVPKKTGKYRFGLSADDGARLFVDDQPVIQDWSVHAERLSTGSMSLAAGTRHKIRIEFFQGTRDSVIHFTWSQPGLNSVTWSSYAAKSIDYYFVYGPQISRVMSTYRALTGPAPLPPKWALGYWQSKERYSTQSEWIEIAEGYRSRHLPIDNLVQDWFYWDPHAWGSHEFDAKRYPDPASAIAELHDKYNLHFMISVWGKFAPGSGADPDLNYFQLNDARLLYPKSVAAPEQYYDAFSPRARDLYWSQMDSKLFRKGVDAWWLDASEPEANLDALNQTPTGAGPGAFVVSGWPLMHTSAVYQGQRAADSKKRVFILTRSAYAGQQRNGAATWSGDITASWDTLAKQIPAGINFCFCGIPYWTTDIGAFFVNYPGGNRNPEYRELYTRWFEYGAFCPIFRSHGTNTPREMWRFGPETETILLKYDRLRYRLMPYIYSSAWKVTTQGETMMRGLAADFPWDLIGNQVKDEFIFGPSLLICPVTSPSATHRQVYLPKGTDWFDFWTSKRIHGGQWIDAPAPLDQEPIYVKAGAIIPMGPDVEYTAQPVSKIELHVYPGANTAFDLYEDSGDGYGYEKGERATTRFTWNQAVKKLTVGKRIGSFPGMKPPLAVQTVIH